MALTYSKLAESTVGVGGSATIIFSNIPQNYNDLLIKLSTRSVAANAVDAIYARFNGSSLEYTNKVLYGETTGTGSFSPSITYSHCGYGVGGNGTASTFSNTEVYIPNYTSANNKSISVDSVTETNATTSQASVQYLEATLWSNVTTISSITFTQESAGNFAQYSTATLYGVKAEV